MPAVSQSQHRLMGQAYALKKGDLKPEDLNPEYREQIEDLAKGMTLKQLKDYAETPSKKLPNKIKIGEMKNIPTFDQFINESRVTWGEELVYDLNRDKATLFVTEYEGLSNDIFFTKDNQAIVTKRTSNIISHGKNPKDLKLDNIKFVYCGIEKEFYSTADYTKLLNAIYRGLNIRNIKPLKVNESLNEAKFTPKQGLMEILDMLNDGWTKDEVANIILNATKGKLDLNAYTGFNGNELSKESQYTK
jgi:hypothetical protein